ncbi:MAG: hypothetical protein IT385_13220 [Deltaproteobacteria bacterium]|nr:hypothetical protein [Deltaproteobacteria bacterium]
MSDPLAFLGRPAGDAPSELQLDRYVAGELAPDDRDKVEAWAAASPENAARLTARKAFPHAPDHERLFARIEARLDAPAAAPARPGLGERARAWWRRLLGPGALSIVVAAAVVLLVVRPWQGDDVIRPKGSFAFVVHKKTPTGSEVLVSGSEARDGDELRFEIDLKEAGFVLVLDQDPQGQLFTAWPEPADAAQRIAARRVEPGARALDGAVALDGTLGDEWLHAVVCTTMHTSGDVTIAGPGRLTLPNDCVSQAVHLKKVP